MISLCITGHSAAAIAAAHAAFTAAGMTPARGLERDPHINFSTWHERVYQALEQRQSEPGEEEGNGVRDAHPANMGRLWEQLANDLFLANMDAQVWGWADAKSLGLLDFWLELDASTHFVLLVTSPEQMLAEHLGRLSREPEPSVPAQLMDRLLAQWQVAHQGMLRFALRNPKRCILVQADELPLPALAQTVKAAWPRQLKALRADHVAELEISGAANGAQAYHLLRHFATEVCAGYPQMLALKHEVESVALALSEATVPNAQDPILTSLLATVSIAHQVPALSEQIAKLQSDLEIEVNRSASALLHHVAQAQAQLLASAESFGKERAANAMAAQAQSALLSQVESDLRKELQISALLTSRRDQEELEKCAALTLVESLSAQLRDAQSQVESHSAELSQAREQLQRDAIEAVGLKSQLASAENAFSDLQAQNQADHLALTQERQEKADALAQCELETKAKFALAVQRDALAVSVSALDDKSTRLETLLRSVEDENTLLLAQLSQVQQELERYYLRNREIGSGADQWALRFRRVMARQVDGIDWESSRAELTPGKDGAQLRCYASQVAVTGKVWDALEFTARIHAGKVEYIFERSPGETGVMTRWPLSVANAAQLVVTDDQNSSNEVGASVLREIGTSDWDLVLGLPKLLGHALSQLKGPWPEGGPRLQAWLEAANATSHSFHRQPMALRFDATRLQASKILANREYLLLRVDQLSLANKRFSSFEFRFGCSLGKAGEFAQNARIEFVKGNSEAAFETWAPNVRDVEGERLDLVFVFPTSMNLKDWTALSINDRGLVLLLADQLPAMLSALILDNISLARPLAQWIDLAEKLRIFVRTRLDVMGVQQIMPDTVNKNLQQLSETSATPRPENRKIKVRSQDAHAKAMPKKHARVVAGVSKV